MLRTRIDLSIIWSDTRGKTVFCMCSSMQHNINLGIYENLVTDISKKDIPKAMQWKDNVTLLVMAFAMCCKMMRFLPKPEGIS